MLKRIAAITGIFVISCVAWLILTLVIWVRTDERSATISRMVGDLWGTEHTQVAPELTARWTTETRREVRWTPHGWQPAEEEEHEEEEGVTADRSGLLGHVTSSSVIQEIQSEKVQVAGEAAGRKDKPTAVDWKTDPDKRHFEVTRTDHRASLQLDGTSAEVDLDVDYRKKGLLWFSTYGVGFRSDYTVRNPTGHEIDVAMRFPYPAADAIYDNMKVSVTGDEGARVSAEKDSMVAQFRVPAGKARVVSFGYHSRGMGQWNYSFGPEVKMVRNFELVMRTDFDDYDFPKGSISPDTKRPLEDGSGWELGWDKESVVSGKSIGMVMPERINPGPLAQGMTLHAPVSLFFFFFVMFILQVHRSIKMHPMNYFFIASGFFAFNLLFSYLVDHLDLLLAFGISAAVSLLLVTTYLRLVVGLRFAFLEAGISQVIYQALFSLAHFLEGYTGLTITVGAIITLAIVMQVTGRTDWAKVFRGRHPVPLDAAAQAD